MYFPFLPRSAHFSFFVGLFPFQRCGPSWGVFPPLPLSMHTYVQTIIYVVLAVDMSMVVVFVVVSFVAALIVCVVVVAAFLP